jgi:exopolysaccharide biosynthesis protein
MMFIKKAFLIVVALLLICGGISAPAYAAAPENTSAAAAAPEPQLANTAEAPLPLSLPVFASETGAFVPAALADNSSFFAAEGQEEVVEDAAKGYWLYRSSTLFVEVKRISDTKGPKTYFVTEIVTATGGSERMGFANPKKPGGSSLALYKMAKNYKAVIAVNGDYMNRADKNKKGIILRDGVTYLNNKKGDTLAFYPDGSLRVFKPKTTTPQKLLGDGVKNTFSFGPTLIDGGKIQSGLDRHRLRRNNPRTAVGMIEPNHYVVVVVDGRQKNYSAGMTLTELANVFKQYGCQVAYNLDGGRSATMSFMGKNISKYGGSLTGQRNVPDALMFGYSDLVK